MLTTSHPSVSRRALSILLACVLLVLVGTSIRQQAKAATAPNVVLILTDDQRFDTLWAMPKVKSLLVNHGMTFDNSFVVNPLCCPSRSTILTGQYSHTTGVYKNAPPYGGFGSSTTRRPWPRGCTVRATRPP